MIIMATADLCRMGSMQRLDALENCSSDQFYWRRLHCRIPLLYSLFCSSPYALKSDNTDTTQVLFAACASVLVKNYAIYAKHSGIPEIKTVLGGFVIRRFMGGWTLVVKSLGLVWDGPPCSDSC